VIDKAHHSRGAQNICGRDPSRQLALLHQALGCGMILLGEGLIDAQALPSRPQQLDGHIDHHPATGNFLGNGLAHRNIQFGKVTRQIDDNVNLLAIYRADFHAKAHSIHGDLTAPESSHTFHGALLTGNAGKWQCFQ
jgi:hypothetical protein